LKTLGIQVADGQPMTLVMSYAQGTPGNEPFAGIPFNGTLAFQKDGKTLWQTTWTTELSSFFSNVKSGGMFAHLLNDANVQLLIDGIPDKTIPGLIPGEWTGPALEIAEPESVTDLLDPSKNDPNKPPPDPVAPTPDKSTRTVAAAGEADERAELKALKLIVINSNNLRASADELAAGVVTKKISQAQFINDVNLLERYEKTLPASAKNLRPETAESIKALKQATADSVTDYRTILKALRLGDTNGDGADAQADAVDQYKTVIGPETDFLKQRLADLETKYP
jgi:hypothetical protein